MPAAAAGERPLSAAVWKPALIVSLALAAFWPTLRVGFMIDDPYLLRAAQSPPGISAAAIKADLTSNVHKEAGAFYYRPVLALLTRAEYSLWGRSPAGYHAVSLLFHAGNAVLLYCLLSSLGLGQALSLLSACLFAVNPLIIDDLLAATGGESMANFLLLGSLLLFLKNRTAAALLLSVPAVFAKESNVTLPLLLAICLAFAGRLRSEYRKPLALLPVCGLYLWLRHLFVDAPSAGAWQALEFSLKSLPSAVFHYLGLLLVPLGLETWPRLPEPSPFWPLYLAAAAAAAAGIFLLPLKRRLAFFCLAWFLAGLAPKVPAMLFNQVLMDKWIFMSAPAVFLLLLGLLELPGKIYTARLRLLPHAVVAAAAVFWIAVAHAEVKLRGSDEKNYRWTLRDGPRLFAGYRLGLILMGEGRYPEAVEALAPLLKLAPDRPDPQNAFAMALWHSGRRAEALKMMTALGRTYPDNVPIKENLARMRLLAAGKGG